MFIPVVFITDNNYVVPTAAAIESLIKNKKKETCYEINIITSEISDQNISLFHHFRDEKKGIRLNIVPVDIEHLKKYNQDGYYVSCNCLLKFNISGLFPQYDKVLYLDGDILVLKDLSDLYNTDLKGNYVGAVADMLGQLCVRLHEKLGVKKYFNAGIMLLNCAKIRHENLEEVLYKTKAEHPEFLCMDQDVHNFVFKEQVLWLNPKNNLMMSNLKEGGYSLEEVNAYYGTNYSSFSQMKKEARIIHLTNKKKPWLYKDAFMAKEWLSYFKASPFKNIPVRYQKEEKQGGGFWHSFKILKKEKVNTEQSRRLTVYFLGLPVLKKYRSDKKKYIKILGCPVYKKKIK